jgi:hypothetical protein
MLMCLRAGSRGSIIVAVIAIWLSIESGIPASASVLNDPNGQWSAGDNTGFCGRVSGGYVLAVQRVLKGRNIYSGNLDGQWGPQTNSATITFQANNNLSGDGCVGPQTWSALQAKTVAVRIANDCQSGLDNYYVVSGTTKEVFYIDSHNTTLSPVGYHWWALSGSNSFPPVYSNQWYRFDAQFTNRTCVLAGE